MYRQLGAGVALLSLILASSAARADADKKTSKGSGHPFVGVRVGEAEDEAGVVVGQVVPDSPASKAGLKRGDVITRVDGREVDSPDTLHNVLAQHKPGETLTFRVKRDGKDRSLKVTLGEAPKGLASGGNEPSEEEDENMPPRQKQAFLGVQAIPIDELTPRLKRRLGISGEEGLVVMEVVPESPASQAGLHHGDVITKVNGKNVEGMEDLIKTIRQTGVGKTLHLTVMRGKEKKTMDAKLEESPVGGLGMAPMGGFPGSGGLGRFPLRPMEAERKIERLERRVRELEDRIQELEQRQKSGTEKRSGRTGVPQ